MQFGIFISAISYIFILYPAWQLTYGYTFIPIFIWIIWKNRKQYKMNWKDFLIILLVILAIAGMGLRYYILSKDVIITVSSTDYPGERFELGGDGVQTIFSYVYSMLFPYMPRLENPCELSGMLSIYPIPMIIALLFIIRNKERKKHFAFIIPALLIGLMLSIWVLVPTNDLFAKLTFLYMAPAARVAVPLGFLQILVMIYLLGNIKEEDKIIKNKYVALIIAVVTSTFILSLAIRTDYENILRNLRSYICGLILFGEIYCLFTINDTKSKNLLIAILIPIALMSGALVNPIHKGIDVITEKPVAKKVQEIVNNEPENNKWLVQAYPNYYLASGAKVLNSVNTYPNFDMYKTILKDRFDNEEYRKIYNRYAHVYVQVYNQESTIELVSPDALIIKLNPETIKELEVKYIIMTEPLEELDTNEVKFENIYSEDGTMIYKVIY